MRNLHLTFEMQESRQFSVFQLILCLLLFSVAPTAASDIEISRDAPAAWVNPLAINPAVKTPEDAGDGGLWHLLADIQIDVASKTRYYHFAYRFLSESGVQESSERSFEFDPSYQELVLHRLRIHRDGKVIDRLPDQEIKTLEREAGHEEQLYDGKLTSVLLLKDVRVGDVLEYAYSIRGVNPIFSGHFTSTQQWGWGSTVHQARYRVIWDQGGPMPFRFQFVEAEPSIVPSDFGKEYVWEQKDSNPVIAETSLPSDFSAYSWIEMSDYRSWNEVRQWARDLYHYPDRLPDELERALEEIERLPNDEKKTLAALRYVQDKIRYVGSFMGEHSHKPYEVKTIMSRRFGDCKDKSLILVSMLRRLGLSADPALVETDYRGQIEDWLPSPFAFDHVVTRVVLNDQVYWLDPTRSFQRGGALDEIYFPDYQKALVLDASKGGLQTVKSPGFLGAKTEVEETFTFDDYKGEVEFEVKTEYRGRDADRIRSYFSSSSGDTIKEDYLDYYANDYPGIEIDGGIGNEDHEGENRYTVTENYRIRDFWEKDDDGKYWVGSFFPRVIYNELHAPKRARRKMPFGLSHLRDVTQKIKIVMPSKWDPDEKKENIDEPAFVFDYEVKAGGNVTDLIYHYVSKKSSMPAKEVKTYTKAIDEAEDLVGYEFTIPESYRKMAADELSKEVDLFDQSEDGDYRPNWLATIIALGALFLGVLAALAVYFWNPVARHLDEADSRGELVGLGGWLGVMAIGLFFRPLLRVADLFGGFEDLDLNVWNELTTRGNEFYHILWGPGILGEVVWDMFVLPLELLLIVLYVQRRTSFPKFMIAELFFMLSQALIFGGVTYVLPGVDEEILSGVSYSIGIFFLTACIWVPYLLLSKRVRNTFTRRRGQRLTPPPLPPSATL